MFKQYFTEVINGTFWDVSGFGIPEMIQLNVSILKIYRSFE